MRLLHRLFAFVGWVALITTTLVIVVSMVVVVVAATGRRPGPTFEEPKTRHAVAVIPLTGEILSAERFRKNIRAAVENEKIKAIVVRIDSPGGAVGAAEEIYAAIQRAGNKKPTVCALENIAASGGLYAASACKKVVTHRGTLTGSIGVIMMIPNFTQVLNRFGVEMTVVKSGRFKDAGSPFRSARPEDVQLLQDLVNAAHEQFVTAVAEGRGIDRNVVQGVADGRVILGQQAVALGLADEIGDLSRAAKLALELTGDQAEPELLEPMPPGGIFRVFNDLNESAFRYWLEGLGGSRLLYRAFL